MPPTTFTPTTTSEDEVTPDGNAADTCTVLAPPSSPNEDCIPAVAVSASSTVNTIPRFASAMFTAASATLAPLNGPPPLMLADPDKPAHSTPSVSSESETAVKLNVADPDTDPAGIITHTLLPAAAASVVKSVFNTAVPDPTVTVTCTSDVNIEDDPAKRAVTRTSWGPEPSSTVPGDTDNVIFASLSNTVNTPAASRLLPFSV